MSTAIQEYSKTEAALSMRKKLTRDEILSRLNVDCASGKCLWIDATIHHKNLIGKEAGSPKTWKRKSYWVIKINGVPYLRSRLVFTVKNGTWPANQVDHINGDSLDDRSCNLRNATQQENSWNHKGRKKASTLPMGIRQIRDKFEARITKSKKLISLGVFSDLREAHSVYMNARASMFGEFA